MAIKTQYEKAEDIPEGLKEHTVEKDGMFVVEVEDIRTHPAVMSLSKAFMGEKEKRKEQSKYIAELKSKVEIIPEDFDPEKWSELKVLESTALDPEKQREKIKAELDAQRQNLKDTLEKKHTIEVQSLQTRISDLMSSLEATYKEDRLRKGLIKADIKQELLDGAMALLRSRVKIVEEKDPNGKTTFKDIVETDMGDISAEEYALQWAQKDEGKPYVKQATGPELNPGSNRHGLPNDNPWKKGNINLTKQTLIFKENPAKAERLKAAAGL